MNNSELKVNLSCGHKIFIFITALILLIPLLDVFTGIIPKTTLSGLDNSSPFPEFKYSEWIKNKYQQRVENWALKRPGIWGWSVRANNELTLRFFNQITTDYGMSVQAGNDGHFMQNLYYNYFNRYKRARKGDAQKKIRALKKLQDVYKEKGLPVLAVISPNIFALYPDVFPDRYRNPRLSDKYISTHPISYDRALPFIEEYGADVFDAYKFLDSEKNNFPFRFFHTTGSHWNDIASCLAMQEVLSRLNQTWKRNDIPKLPCRDYEMRNPPHDDDLDLLYVTNLLFPSRLFNPAPYIKLNPETKLAKPLKILIVGTSFTFALQKQLIQNGLSENSPVYFYFRSARNNIKESFRGINKSKIDWEKLPQEYDAIIIESNVSNVSRMGYGFIEAALKHLKPKSSDESRSSDK